MQELYIVILLKVYPITDSLARPVQTGKVETNKPRQNLGRTRLVLSTSCHYLALVLV